MPLSSRCVRLVAGILLLGTASSTALAAGPCAVPTTYPGDAATRPAIAAWMAAGAETAGLPSELPVLAALVESGLNNVRGGDRDSVGFFQMRTALWDKDGYAGFATDPAKQLKWFIDRAIAARNDHFARRDGTFGEDESDWGRWVSEALDGGHHRRRLGLVLLEAKFLVAIGKARATTWAFEGPYPGDDAPRARIAAWMATRAIAAGLPGELPIMAALVESGLTNASSGDRDVRGFFGMRVSIWNVPPYEGFPDNPELQVKWFIDQARAVRERNLAADPFFGQDPGKFGDWIADVERPAEEFRGRYQLRLSEARGLMVSGCRPTN